MLISCVLWQTEVTAGAEDNRRVLVFYEQGQSTTAVALVDREIREVLEKQTTYHIDLYVEYMETNLFVDPASQQKIREWYLQKYQNHQPDVIIAVGSTPIHFMIDVHENNVPGVTIVICGATENWSNRSELDSQFTGTMMDPDPARTLDIALKLRPGTDQVIVVNGDAPLDKSLEALFRKSLRSIGGYVSSYATQGQVAAEDVMVILGGEKPQNIPIVSGASVYLFDWRALDRWGFKKGSLPIGSIVLNRQPTLWEAYGPYVAVAVLLLFAQTMLILELLRQRKKERMIRRHLRESETRLREAQSIAQCGSWVWDISRSKTYWSDEMYRILGLVPQSVLPTSRLIHPGDDQYYVTKMKEASETHQLYSAEHRIVRPNGEERMVLEFGQPKYDSQQRLVSISGTMLDVTEQRRAERVLRESEERFRAMADGAPVMMWMSGVDKLCTDFNRGWLTFTGRSIEQELGNGWTDGVHPDDLQKCFAIYVEAFDKRQPFSMEYRLRRYDGEYHWISDAGSPRFLADGTFAGYIGCCVDINDRKAVEFTRLELARRLMSSQEAERTRVARELHDGIGQEIALLGIQMQRAASSIALESGPIFTGMQKLCAALTDIGLHISRLSHQLHSSELEYLGLSVAITKLCREFSEQYSIKVACACTNIPAKLDNDLALTFLRVVQESLHNIAKHSDAKDVQVEVTGAPGELSLIVRDNGAGFNVQESKAAAGLGLISMRERVHLIGGEFAIDSAQGAGTCIRVRVPLAAANLPAVNV